MRGRIAAGMAVAIWGLALLGPCGVFDAMAREASQSVLVAGQEAEQGAKIALSENVFVVPDARAKAVTGWLIVKAGCADEANGDCRGLAHYLEHLLFLNRGTDHNSRISIFGGGSANGWTTLKSTTYFQRFPAKPETDQANLDKLIAHFAGLLTDVKAEAAAAERERNIVLQEYNLKWGQSVYQRFGIARNLALLPGDPLGQRVGGSPETIAAFTPEAARTFHKTWYAKSNAVLVLHGPIDPEAVKPIVAKYIASLPAIKVPARTWSQLRRYDPSVQILNETDKDARLTDIRQNN
jgi:zinc protease